LLLALTGGLRFHLGWIVLSSRDPTRPLIAAMIALVLARLMPLPGESDVRSATVRERWLRLAVGTAAVATLVAGLMMGARSIGGSDSYGYVSQAALWRHGVLRIPQPFVQNFQWPGAAWKFSTLGYQPAPDGSALVPTYAPGVPALITILTPLLGPCAPFYLGPLCATALVLLTYRIGSAISSPLVGAAAALWIAASPTLLMMIMSPMSDVPAAALWMAAFAAALAYGRPRPVLAGIAIGFAVLVRPNLVPLAVGPALAVWFRTSGDRRRRLWSVLTVVLAMVPFALIVAAINARLYGSALVSGYGAVDAFVSLGNVNANLHRYPGWLLESQGSAVLAFIAGPLLWRWSRERTLALFFVALVFAIYLTYTPFDDWWYLRFLLPAFPLLMILCADAVAALPPPRVRPIVLALFTIFAAWTGIRFASAHSVWSVGHSERRYAEMANYVAKTVPQDAVVFAMQHSGTIRYYAGRLTARYDEFDVESLDRAVDDLARLHRLSFLVLDESEEPIFRGRFAAARAASVLTATPLAVADSPTTVRLYALNKGGSPEAPALVPRLPPGTCLSPALNYPLDVK
jgi:hypothetical protein